MGIGPGCERRKRSKKRSIDSPPSAKCDSFMRNMRASEDEKVRERERVVEEEGEGQ